MIKLKEKYKKEAVPAMKEKFGYKNVMALTLALVGRFLEKHLGS